MRAKRSAVTGVLAASAIASATLVRAGQQGVGQTPSQFPLSQPIRERGSSVTGAYEGWYRDKDGSIRLLVGYFNRNTKEDLDIPVGPGNRIEPGGPDQGQPTHFFPRRNRFVFRVTVPKDFGKKEVVWTVTMRGKTERAVGWLQPEWEIEEVPGETREGAKSPNNQAPTLALTSSATSVTLPSTLTLTADVTDDGLPKPGKPRTGGTSENPPTQ